jgi:hypothetical protein
VLISEYTQLFIRVAGTIKAQQDHTKYKWEGATTLQSVGWSQMTAYSTSRPKTTGAGTANPSGAPEFTPGF